MTLEEYPSVCTFDCPDTCSLSVTVENERIVRVRGSMAAPFTDGVICNKVAQDMTSFVHGERRLLHPLQRTGPKGSGRLERISWDAALDDIDERVGEDPPLGSASSHAAELCRPAWIPRGRQHVDAVLPPAGREPAVPAVTLRRRAERGVDLHLRGVTRMPARIRRARQAERRLGQQRDRRQPTPGAARPPGEAQGQPAGRRGPVADQDRRAGGSASRTAPRYRHAARLVARRRVGAGGRA